MIEGKIWFYGCLTIIFLRKREKQAALRTERQRISHYKLFIALILDQYL